MIMLNRRLISTDQEAVVGACVQRPLYGSHKRVVFIPDRLQRHLAKALYRRRFFFSCGRLGAQNELAGDRGSAGLARIDKSDQTLSAQDRGNGEIGED